MSKPIGLFQTFEPPGPKAAAWLHSTHPMSFIMGPVGSAKTTTGAMKCLDIVRRQHPSTRDGVRKAHIVAVRMNYRQMWRSLIRSWQKVWPPEVGKWTAERDGPAMHVIKIPDQRFGDLELTVEFVSVSDNDLESFIRGYEPTAWWLNEVDELPPGCLGLFYQRVGRAYLDEKPDPDEVAPAEYSKIFGDLNAPDEDNWFNQDFILNPPDDCALYIQPSGFSPNAENLKALRRIDLNYYQSRAKRMKQDRGEWAVRRFIMNETGYSRSGQPVYADFNDRQHVGSDTLEPYSGSKIIIGIDQGLTPAAAFCQAPPGRFLILSELVTPQGDVESGYDFGRRIGRHMLAEFPGFCRPGGFEIAPDPAARARTGGGDVRQWVEHLQRGVLEVVGLCPFGMPLSNALDSRIGPVKAALTRLVRGEAALLVHPRCRWIRRGFNGGYRLVRVQGKDRVFKDKPDKGEYSHVMNAMEYAAQRGDPSKAGSAEDISEQWGAGVGVKKRPPHSAPPHVISDHDY